VSWRLNNAFPLQIREAKKAALLEQKPKPAEGDEEGNETEAEASELAEDDDAPNVAGECLKCLVSFSLSTCY
jgi:hypothetical protein